MKNQKIVELTTKLEEGIKTLFGSNLYKQYLTAMSKFTEYSFNNSLLIFLQRPDASFVASYNSWKNDFDRQVLEGAKGIKIIQPIPSKKMVTVEKVDEKGRVVLGKNGEPEKEITEKFVLGFKVGYVFAIEDTTGTPLPEIVTTLTQDVNDYQRFFQAICEASPAPIYVEKMDTKANGFYSINTNEIHVRDGMSEAQTLKTIVHEIAHAVLHNKESGIDLEANRNEREVEAESVAYAVCSYYGLDTSDYSFGYVLGWSKNKDLDELRKCMNSIHEATRVIIEKIDKTLLELRMTLDVDELAYKLQDGYFYIQKCDDGYDYSFIDRWGKLADGGIVETGKTIDTITQELLREHGKDIRFATLHDVEVVKEKIDMANQMISYREKPSNICLSRGIGR